jgi:antirestriction protein ArdC
MIPPRYGRYHGKYGRADKDTPRSARLLRLFTVFNVAQFEDLPARLTQPEAVIDWNMVSAAEAIITHSGADIRHGGNAAYYSVSLCMWIPATVFDRMLY